MRALAIRSDFAPVIKGQLSGSPSFFCRPSSSPGERPPGVGSRFAVGPPITGRPPHVPKESGIGFMLEADRDVVRVADDDHVARGPPPSPAVGPEVEDIVQVDVGQER